MTESDLLKLLILRVTFALPAVRVYRREILNRTVELDGRKVHLRIGIPGQGDAYAMVDGGLHVEIEAKAASGKLRAAQERWQADCLKRRIPHLVVRAMKSETADETVGRWLEELRAVVESRT